MVGIAGRNNLDFTLLMTLHSCAPRSLNTLKFRLYKRIQCSDGRDMKMKFQEKRTVGYIMQKYIIK